MPRNILIDPQRLGSANPNIQFSGSMANTIKLEVLTSGSLQFTGVSGSLLSIVDSLSGSLFAVSDVSGLPILETFSDDRVVMGRFGTNALVVTGSFVGIGTSNPATRLHLFSSTADAMTLASAAGTTYIDMKHSTSTTFGYVGNGGMVVGASTSDVALRSISGGVVFATAGGAERMRVDSVGNIGIGTSTPTARLFVSGAVNSSTPTMIVKEGVSSPVGGAALLDVQNSAGTSILLVSGSGTVGISNSNVLYAYSQGMKLDVRGNIGITNGGGIFIGDGTTFYRRLIAQDISPTNVLRVGADTAQFSTLTLSSQNSFDLLALSQGNVGIGSTSPTARFQVSGSATASTPTMIVQEGVVNPTGGVGILNVQNSAGTSILFVSGSGNVGIRQTTPSSYEPGMNNLVVGDPAIASTGITLASSTQSTLSFANGTSGGQKYAGYMQYSHGAGRLDFGSAATTRMSIRSNGNVGIGGTNPNARFEVTGSGTGATNTMHLVNSAGTSLMIVRDNGTVGIGTATPAVKLDFGASGGFLLKGNPGPATSVVYTGHFHNDFMIGAYIDGSSYSNGVLSFGHVADPARKFHIGSASDANFNASTSFVPTMTFTAGNNVGIGTTIPGARFEVTGSSSSSGAATISAKNSSGTSLMYVRNDGKIGIGTTTFSSTDTTSTLEVSGSVYIQQNVDNDIKKLQFISSVSNTALASFESKRLVSYGSEFRLLIGRAAGGTGAQNVWKTRIYDDPTSYPNQNTHTTFNMTDTGGSNSNGVDITSVVYIGNGSNSNNTRPSLYATNDAFLAVSRGGVGIGTTVTNGNVLSVTGSTAITGSVLPGIDNTYDLGSASKRWANIYAANFSPTSVTAQLTGSNLVNGMVLFAGATGGITGSQSQFFWDNSTNRLGIGTSSPTSTVDISGLQTNTGANSADSPTGTLRLNYAGQPTPGFGPSIVFSQQWFSGAPTSFVATGQISGVKTNSGGSYGGGLAFFYGPNGLSSLSEGMRINGSGNVGIGTTNPDARLTLSGSSDLATFYNSSGTKQLTVQNSGDLSFNTSTTLGLVWGNASLKFNGQLIGVQVVPFTSAYVGFSVVGKASQTYALQTWQNSAGTVLSLVDANGSIGLGVTTVSSPLTTRLIVSGSSTASDQTMLVKAGTATQTGPIFEVEDYLGNTLLVVSSSGGAVGIGTTLPQAKFHVVSSTAPNGANLYVGYAGSNNYYDANTHHFRDGGSNTRFTINSNGNIVPSADNVSDLGSTSLRWRNVFATNISGSLTGSNLTAGQVVVAGTGGLLSGTNQFVWDNTNSRVGIGTATPSYAIDARVPGNTIANLGGIGMGGALYFGNGASQINHGNNEFGFYTLQSKGITFNPNNTFAVSIVPAGRVGIGGTNPLARFEVTGSGSGAGATMHLLNSSNTSLMYVRDDGYVGIGTNTPTASEKLSVIGSMMVGQGTANTSATYLHLTSGGGSYDALIDFGYYTTFDASLWQIGRNGATGQFQINDTSSGFSNNALAVTVSTRNVGIGTTSFSARFHVSGSSTASTPTMVVKEGTIPANATGAFDVQNYLGTSLLFVSGSGNVGIGITAPRALLDLKAAAAAVPKIKFGEVVDATTNYATAYVGATRDGASGYKGALIFATGDSGDNAAEKARLDSAGNLLVRGTTQYGSAKLQVVYGDDSGGSLGYAQIGLQYFGGGYSHYIQSLHNTVADDGNAIRFYLNTSNTAGGSSAVGTGNALSYFMGYSTHRWNTGGSERVRIDSSGNVGIGTTNPNGNRLSISGGNLSVTGSVLPGPNAASNGYDLGSTTYRWRDLYARSGSFSGDLTIAGDLTVMGTSSIINSEVVNIKDNIILLNAGPSPLSTGGIYVADTNPTAQTGSFIWDTSTNRWKAGLAGLEADIPTGSGTAGYLTRWATASTFGNSVVFDDGTNVGVGTSTILARLHVSGSSTAADQTMLVRAGVTNQTGPVFEVENNVGTSLLIVSSSGNVGIGTGLPVSKFEVVGTSGSLLSVTDSLSGSLFSVNDITGVPILEVFSDDRVVAGAVNTNALVVTGSIVGIGTSLPQASLDVRGTANTYALLVSGSTTFGQSFGQIINAGSNSGDVTMRVRNYNGTSEYLFVRGDGNVGVGTASNFAGKLHVYGGNLYIDGTAGASSTATYSNSAYARLVFDNDYSDVARGPNRITLHDNAGTWIAGFGIHSNTVGYYSGATHAWYTMTSANPTLYMSLTSAGSLLPGSNNAQDIGSTSLYWRNLYVSNISGSFTGSNLTAGQVVVAGTGGVLSGSNNFWWSNSNGRVGIGTNSPTNTLDVRGRVYTTDSFFAATGAPVYMADSGALSNVSIDSPAAGQMRFRIANSSSEAMRIDSSGNVGINTSTMTLRLEVSGSDARIHDVRVGRGPGSVVSNVVVGNFALNSNTSGASNIGIGYYALSNTTTGGENIGIGEFAGNSVTTQFRNTYVGRYSGLNLAGSDNTGFGARTLQGVNGSGGNYNTAVGSSALFSSTTASNNTAIGYAAGQSVTTGGNNFFGGYQAGFSTSTATNGVIIGYQSGYFNASGSNNILIGYQAGYGVSTATTTGYENVTIGGITSVGMTSAHRNVIIGHAAGNGITTSNNGVAIGYGAAFRLTTGDAIVAVGSSALSSITTAGNSTAVGYQALRGIDGQSTGGFNTALGSLAGTVVTSGASNTFVGYQAGASVSVANNNSFLGLQAGALVTSGSGNVALGYQAGDVITTGANNIIIGSSADVLGATNSNSIVIGQGETGRGSNTTVIGNASTTLTLIPSGSLAMGGTAAGANAVSLGINNTASGNQSVAIGNGNVASSTGAFALGTLSTASTGGYNFAIGSSTLSTGITAISMGNNTTASGAESQAIGRFSLASGAQAIAIGSYVTGSAASSVAIGRSNNVSGIDGVALGNGNTVSGQSAVVIGTNSQAYSTGAQAFGVNAYSSNAYATAIGVNVGATGNSSVAIGNLTTASGQNSIATGFNNTASGFSSFTAGQYSLASGAQSVAIGQYVTGSVNNAIAIGSGSLASGIASIAFGELNTSSTTNSVAIGKSNTSGGSSSTAIGRSNSSSGSDSIAIGAGNISNTTSATSIGASNTASGNTSFAAGFSNTSSNFFSVALGAYNASSGFYSFAAGGTNTASGTSSVAMGQFSLASGAQAIAIGSYVTGSNTSAVAIGVSNVASGVNSVAIGNGNTASSTTAVAIGNTNTASTGIYAVAIGQANTSSGVVSVAIGNNNVASADNSFVTGRSGRGYLWGQRSHSANAFASQGDAQISSLVARNTTTNASATELFLETSSSTRLVLPASTTWDAEVTIVARSSGGTSNASFKRRCIIKRDASNNTALVGPVQVVGSDIGSNVGSPPAGWGVTLSADDTNESLKIEVTGAVSTNIRWVAKIELTEVGYA